MSDGCHYCGTPRDLRPYGPGGSMVCHPCATATPERQEQTKAAFATLIGAAEAVSPVGVAAIGQPAGPVPFELPGGGEVSKRSAAPVISSTGDGSDSGCFTCSENGDNDYPEGECPQSKRPCGHHDDCLWDMDVCHWCGAEYDEDGNLNLPPFAAGRSTEGPGEP